jgi:pSer/pThr/pTyr-binding forkhead associated (FHA) protein
MQNRPPSAAAARAADFRPPAPGPPGTPSPPREVVPAKALRGFLVAYGTNPAGEFWSLTGGRHNIGRMGSSEALEIPLSDPTVSARHAAIVVDAESGILVVEDTGSTNGTFVNDEHIGYGGSRELRDGDRLRVGGYTTVVKVIGRI